MNVDTGLDSLSMVEFRNELLKAETGSGVEGLVFRVAFMKRLRMQGRPVVLDSKRPPRCMPWQHTAGTRRCCGHSVQEFPGISLPGALLFDYPTARG